MEREGEGRWAKTHPCSRADPNTHVFRIDIIEKAFIEEVTFKLSHKDGTSVMRRKANLGKVYDAEENHHLYERGD